MTGVGGVGGVGGWYPVIFTILVKIGLARICFKIPRELPSDGPLWNHRKNGGGVGVFGLL